jgi:hypothetical protein
MTVDPYICILQPEGGEIQWHKNCVPDFPEIYGNASLLSLVNIQITKVYEDITWYWDGNCWTDGPTWLPAMKEIGFINWQYCGLLPPVENGVTYTITAMAEDEVGNTLHKQMHHLPLYTG